VQASWKPSSCFTMSTKRKRLRPSLLDSEVILYFVNRIFKSMTPQPVAFSRRFIYVGVALLRFKYPIFGVTVLEVNHWVWDRIEERK
jgi:hypothetical protein